MAAPSPDIVYYFDVNSLVMIKQGNMSAKPQCAIRVRLADASPLTVEAIASEWMP